MGYAARLRLVSLGARELYTARAHAVFARLSLRTLAWHRRLPRPVDGIVPSSILALRHDSGRCPEPRRRVASAHARAVRQRGRIVAGRATARSGHSRRALASQLGLAYPTRAHVGGHPVPNYRRHLAVLKVCYDRARLATEAAALQRW